MIVRRERNINPDHTEVSMPISFGSPDIRQYMKWFCRDGWKPITVAKQEDDFKEAEVREWAETSCFVFGIFESHWRTQLSAWFLRQAIKMGYFVQSAADPTRFYFGDAGMAIMKPIVNEWDKLED